MAVFPCAVGLHRYAGPQQTAYLGLVSASGAARSKRRLCPKHFQDLNTSVQDSMTLVAIGELSQIEDEADLEKCVHLEGGARRSTAFATVYAAHDEPRQYTALLCDDCAASFAQVHQIDV